MEVDCCLAHALAANIGYTQKINGERNLLKVTQQRERLREWIADDGQQGENHHCVEDKQRAERDVSFSSNKSV